MPELTIGSPPRGGDYFDQEDLIERLWSHLKKDNVLLVAPRRFGKTGAMYKLLDDPRNDFIPIYIDVESTNTASEFMVELIARLIRNHHFLQIAKTIWTEAKKFGKFLRNLPSSLDFGGLKVEIREKTDIQKKWLDYGEQMKSLLSKEGQPPLLIIDEFPIMINNILERNYEEAKKLLRWFRSVRTAPETKARFVIGGSINLVSTLEYKGLVDTINDMAVIGLKPFTIETAKKYIESIFASRGETLSEDVKDTILKLLGPPIPYFLAVLLTAIFERAAVKKCRVTAEIVQQAFDEDLLGGSTSVVLQHYRARIDQYYLEMEGRAAKEILAILSRLDKPVIKDTLYQVYLKTGNLAPGAQAREEFMRLMNKLENDFYITAQDEVYAFYSPVLKMWWKTHYGWHGQPISDTSVEE